MQKKAGWGRLGNSPTLAAPGAISARLDELTVVGEGGEVRIGSRRRARAPQGAALYPAAGAAAAAAAAPELGPPLCKAGGRELGRPHPHLRILRLPSSAGHTPAAGGARAAGPAGRVQRVLLAPDALQPAGPRHPVDRAGSLHGLQVGRWEGAGPLALLDWQLAAVWVGGVARRWARQPLHPPAAAAACMPRPTSSQRGRVRRQHPDPRQPAGEWGVRTWRRGGGQGRCLQAGVRVRAAWAGARRTAERRHPGRTPPACAADRLHVAAAPAEHLPAHHGWVAPEPLACLRTAGVCPCCSLPVCPAPPAHAPTTPAGTLLFLLLAFRNNAAFNRRAGGGWRRSAVWGLRLGDPAECVRASCTCHLSHCTCTCHLSHHTCPAAPLAPPALVRVTAGGSRAPTASTRLWTGARTWRACARVRARRSRRRPPAAVAAVLAAAAARSLPRLVDLCQTAPAAPACPTPSAYLGPAW